MTLPHQEFFFTEDECYPEGTLSDIECRGVKVASAFPGHLDNVTLRCVGVDKSEVKRVPHDPNRPVESKYTEGDRPVLILPEKEVDDKEVIEASASSTLFVSDETTCDEDDCCEEKALTDEAVKAALGDWIEEGPVASDEDEEED